MKNFPIGRYSRLNWRMVLLALLLLSVHQVLPAADRTARSLGGSPVLFPDGDFESPNVNGFAYSPSGSAWTFHNGAGLSDNNSGFTSGNPNAPQGSQVLFIQTGGRMTQTLDFVAGQYVFSLKAAQRGNWQASYQVLELRVDGVAVQTIQPAGTAYQSFSTAPITLSSGSHTIELRGLNPNGGDNTAFVDEFTYTRQREIFRDGGESPNLAAGTFQYAASGGPWTLSNGGGIAEINSGFTNGSPTPPQGSQIIFLQGGGQAIQSVNISQAGFYRVKFQAALRANMANQVKNVRVSFAGVQVAEVSLPSTNYTAFKSASLYLNPGTYTLKIQGINPVSGDHTGFVDDVSVEHLLDWQDPVAWSGAVPGSNDNARIPSGTAVGMRGTMNAANVTVSGDLVAALQTDFNLNADNIMVMGSDALFEVGQENALYTADANVTLTASASDPDVGPMGNNFLGAMNGGTVQLHGAATTSWTRLAANVNAGGTSITLAEPVNWNTNDVILLVSSRTNWNEAEKRTIASVTGGGTVLNLNQALQYPHKGVVQSYFNGTQNLTADIRAEVGLLSHNIRIEGNAAAASGGFGGHIMIMNGSAAYVEGVELYNMGQKAILGRYPFHWHMLGDGGQGQYFKRSSVHQSYNRAITIHGTESTLVEDNFFYDHIGHGVFLEDGSERFNVIRGNVTLLSKRPAPGEELTPSDNQFNQVQNRTPSSYWITNPQNTFEDNVAAGTEGTGYWFAFPTSPMGLSASDPRFSSMQPHKLPLISFARNSAHSCMTGLDIFDQLNPDHSIKTNWGWDEASDHVMESCLWYANDLALYSGIGVGGPVENLIFRNNVLLENKVGIMLASYSKVDQSAIVASSGQGLVSGQRYAYRVYDGAGQVLNSYFTGWNASNANLLLNTGAAIKHPNHLFNNNGTDHSGFVRVSLPNFDIAPTYSHANAPGHPRFWSIVIKDQDGGITGVPNTTIIGNQPFQRVGDEFKPSNWVNAYRSPHHFALALLYYNLPFAQIPNVSVTRTKTGTPTESVYYIDGYKEHHQLPFIVNEDFLYTYTYEALPTSKFVALRMDDAQAGDDYLVRFTDFGKLGGLSLSSSQGSFTSHSSLSSLQNASSSGYFRESNGDLYIKAVATGKIQNFNISWNTNFTVPVLDSDGDQMADGLEVTSGRHPFDASDLAAEFASNGNFEGWDQLVNISGGTVSNGMLSGTSINNGDAQIVNTDFNFLANEVDQIQIYMRSSASTGVQMFFATNSAPGFSASRVVSASHPGGNAWKVVTLDMSGHGSWNGTVTDLRLDAVSGVGKSFDIGWIRAASSSKTQSWASEEFLGELHVSPNPFGDFLRANWNTEAGYEMVQLTDLQGRLLAQRDLLDGQNSLDWTLAELNLPAGTYLLRFVGPAATEVRRMVKLPK